MTWPDLSVDGRARLYSLQKYAKSLKHLHLRSSSKRVTARFASFASYFELVFVPLCWISRRESSGYTFATNAQTYEEF